MLDLGEVIMQESVPIIQLQQLTKKYGEQLAVNNLNLSINKGEIFGLLGPNGAGKTTTILMMLGLTEPSSGQATICGYDAVRQSIAIKRKVGYMPDDIGFYDDRSGIDNILFTAKLNQIPTHIAVQRAKQLLQQVGLEHVAYKKVSTYSRGMRQRLGLADVLMKQPEVIILDEPTLGIDPEGIRELLQLIYNLSRNEQLTVLLSSHHLHQVQQICDRVGIFVQGNLVACGNIEALSQQLDQEQLITIEMEVSKWDEDVKRHVLNVEGVQQIKEVNTLDENHHRIILKTNLPDAGAKLLRELMTTDVAIHQFSKQQYGLDDIYHRYFQGGE